MPEAQQERLQSFGRRRGRRIRSFKLELVETLLPQLRIDLPESGNVTMPQLFPESKQGYFLEIGFGTGEHLAHLAALHPEIGFIGCEPYEPGVAGLLAHIEERKLTNIRIFTEDARMLMNQLPDACLDRAFILYPDPWPKTRHNKRRLVSTPMLNQMAQILKPGAELRLATDHAEYATWMLERLLANPAFEWTAKKVQNWLTPWPQWTPTRYEQKALAGIPTYLSFRRG